MAKDISKLMTDTKRRSETSENNKQDKYQKNLHLGISYKNCRKLKTKQKNLERSQMVQGDQQNPYL